MDWSRSAVIIGLVPLVLVVVARTTGSTALQSATDAQMTV